MPDISIDAIGGGSFTGYLSLPKANRGPGVVVIQEVFGVNQVMREISDEIAALGYVALCPDLFWRQEPGIQITDKSEAEWKKAFQLFGGFDVDKGVSDLVSTMNHLRSRPECTGKVGTVGYCLGGKLAYLMATRSDADCSVSFYGVGLDALVDEAKSITRPLLMHIAEKDKFVPPEAQAKVKAALAGHPQVTVHSYPGVDHAFARIGGEHFDRAAADLANERTRTFFKTHLG
ncbi:carboxymethylenebutenolidase [Stella humosa]|uniref:Carboxymethylenebutenolidase n=1 Tax=Stella humosa TaxID=94 RepID=A0A3N1L8E2_9PROT|nr:dienelactone hydrolase family protein [Stella humosa]ROP90953.1 carboxymethylenebutenolidase [Stella humosa]BBK34697.1 carboxymethylenebutenolidase [Stella humosa]